MWDARTGRAVLVLPLGLAQPWSLAFSPDSRSLAVGTAFPEGAVRLWDTRTGQERVLVRGNDAGWHHSKVGTWAAALAFSPDGQLLAVNGLGDLALYRVVDGAVLWRRKDRDQDGHVLAFSPDGKMLVSATQYATLYQSGPAGAGVTFVHQQVQLLDARTGRVRANFPNPPNVLTQAATISPDGRCLAVASEDMDGGGVFSTSLTLRALPSGWTQWSRTVRANGIGALCFSPGCRTLVAEEGQEALASWDVGTGMPLAYLPGHQVGWSDTCDVLAFSPDSRMLLHRQGKEVQLWQARILR